MISDADVVVIGAPPEATATLLPQVLALAEQNGQPVVTDMASIKGFIVEAAVPAYARFVPGHPIAGSETAAWVRHLLFEGREVILTPTDMTKARQ